MMSFPITRRARRSSLVALAAAAGLCGAQATQASADAQASSQAQPGYTVQGCPVGYLCFYSKVNYRNGSNQAKPTQKFVHCGTVNLSGWTTRHGSYIDNQTGTPISAFYAGYGGDGAILRAFQPFSYDSDYDFYPVNSIKVC